MIGFFIGFVSFLLAGAGLGGGVLLVPMLVGFLGFDAAKAKIVCMAAYVLASVFSLCVSVKTKMLTYKIFKYIPLGVLGAVVGSFITLDGKVFLKVYGAFLIFFGLYIVYNVFFKQKTNKNEKKL